MKVTDDCIECGMCIANCPQQAIDKDFKINIAICNNCGDCIYNCPTGAIEEE